MILTPQKALNKAYRRQSINKDSLVVFKSQLLLLLDSVNKESEENHKNDFIQFLNDTFYKGKHYINTKDKIDCVINAGTKNDDDVNVIIEHKSPSNKSEMITISDINKKALQESILYYMRERFDKDGKDNNTNLKQILITNNSDLFIFDAVIIENLFAKNKRFKKDFIEFEAGQKSGGDTGFFYNSICKPFIESIKDTIEFTYVNLTDYRKLLESNDDSSKILNLYKLFSPTHLLKLNFSNDSNTLDKNFYNELLHIIGLEEVKDGGKKVIQQCKKPNYGSILENTIDQVKTEVRLSDVSNIKSFGETRDEQIYNISLELVITWINRILFLKLLESQLISYNNSNEYKFVDIKNITDNDSLYLLFFKVLAVKTNDRRNDIAEKYKQVPYLNSSLFEITELERQAIGINTLSNNLKLPLASSTVLKDNNGKRLSGEKEALSYLLEFLDAYNFSSEGTAQVQEDNKTLINAAVLGLIYEKLNGYKDGSFFTPGYITMYMCHETIRRAVVQKFNDSIDDVTFDSFDDLTAYTRRYFKADDITRFNKIVNSIRICDPAVGSGHFLVSALNELIAIKHELGILADKELKPLPIDLEIENDELMITDRFDELFSYNPNSKDSQNIQETLFHEKQTLIENCLFGVDINPNSVKICRLRLWIELLKNTYYKENGELEVLPNIDINIKCGNSLIARFDIDTPISKALKKSKLKVQDYKDAVYGYKNAKSKEQKENLENLIAEIKGNFQSEVASNDKRLLNLIKLRSELEKLETQDTMFEMSKAEEKTYEKQMKTYKADITKLEAELEEIKSNRIYDNAFEWRFEFPEILADNGDFIGFDVVIGNPPYGVKLSSDVRNIIEKTYKKVPDYEIYYWFLNLSHRLISNKSYSSMIIPNTILFNVGAQDYRLRMLDDWKFLELLDLTDLNIFSDATVRNIVYLASKNNEKISSLYYRQTNSITTFDELVSKDLQELDYSLIKINNANWGLLFKLSINVLNLISKIKSTTIELSNTFPDTSQGLIAYDKYRGQSQEIIKNRVYHTFQKTKETHKKWLYGGDVTKYNVCWNEKEFIEYGDGIANPRDPKFFKGERILIREITNPSIFAALTKDEYYNDPAILIIMANKESDFDIRTLLAIFNSRFASFYHFNSSPKAKKGAFPKILVYDINNFPIPKIDEVDQKPIITLVDQILEIKRANPEANTTEIEWEIDLLVYKLYDLTYDEVLIVDPETSITREVYGG
ncbi:MAG: Eco57I restriction-modification methylase domain-containing protein [Melioribacteraceae bacterium]|nr:Eco57I restriction-modification methylase domain-containing protein [Melioribacteraceae bacterium]